jgi:hypothetical protein
VSEIAVTSTDLLSRDPAALGRRTVLRATVGAAIAALGVAGCSEADADAPAAAPAASPEPAGTSHTSLRISVPTGLSWELTVERFEQTVPPLPAAQLAAALRSKPFAEVKSMLANASPVSLFVFHALDATPFMKAAGHTAKAKTYLIGNPLIAETMYGYDAGVMLYAPMRLEILTVQTGATVVAMDRPSDLFASFDERHVATTGHTLNAKLAELFERLKFPVPPELRV